ncbi:hypothetical protein MKW92_005664 [Papaver armeniacum]|nr:hypothetical protein MKW92_005664 [Papaver armeniacum]
MKQFGDGSKFPPLVCKSESYLKLHPLTSSDVVMGNELLLCEILSRLPVKSLMRFKCVCKRWQSLIHKDRRFIDLHFTRSKSRSFVDGGCGISLFMRWPKVVLGPNIYLSTELVLYEGGVTTVQREVPISGASIAAIFGVVNGLVSLINDSYSVCVFNPSTGQSTPWIKSVIAQQHENLREEIQVIDEDGGYVTHQIHYVHSIWHYFGYDPATLEHKVVFLWWKVTSNYLGILGVENICEVMTVGGRHQNNLLWRKIDDSLPPTICPFDFVSSLYANGSIYWLRTGSKSVTEPLVIEFNVGSEKFRIITIPNFIIEDVRYPYISALIQIDGRLAVLAKKILPQSRSHLGITKNNKTSAKMCVLYYNDSDDQDKKLKGVMSSATATSSEGNISSSSDCYWVEESFMMPPFDWDWEDFDSILAVPDTDLFFIRSEGEAGSSFYLYDWRKKSFSKDVEFFIKKRKFSYPKPLSFVYYAYKESILPVI